MSEEYNEEKEVVSGSQTSEEQEETLSSLELQSAPFLSSDEGPKKFTLGGMYRSWFLDYASYVILERAVPHIEDGLKPVQRRVLYAMHLMENGLLHKVAKIVGATMAYHPHGDSSINDALVQLGQKGFLIDTQGNWGNIQTGDAAAAGRYIEAKLSDFALDILFGNKITPWKKSYDGKELEPIYLPVRFPLLLAQGAEGIAVGLSSRILPHNPKELLEATCAYLSGTPFGLYPDFPTGGLIDVERYNDGKRGGVIKNRARIEKLENRVLSIKDLPYGKTTTSIIDSILKANEKGLIKVRRVDDMTAEEVDVRIYLPAGVSTDKTIDGLYAFTDCEINIWPNACVIQDDKPVFMGVSDLLKYSALQTKNLLKQDLSIKLQERREQYLLASLERIFIEHRIYKKSGFENASDEANAIDFVRKEIEKIIDVENLITPLKVDDFKRLLEIKMAKILKFNLSKHEEMMLRLENEMKELEDHITHINQYTIKYCKKLIETYGALWQRKTAITRFGSIEASKVVEVNQKLYIDREGGFAGTALKGSEYVCDCSEIDDMLVFFKNGTFMVTPIEEKKFLGKDPVLHIQRYIKGDTRTVFNVIYRDGKSGPYYIKRFNISSALRDKTYDVTQGNDQSRVEYFSVNPNGEAEVVSIKQGVQKESLFKNLKDLKIDFSKIAIRNRGSKGNLVTRNKIQKVSLLFQGGSTLGGRKVWFDPDVNRINYDSQGKFLGEFEPNDKICVMRSSGELYIIDFGESNYFETTPELLEKLDVTRIWTAVYWDQSKKYYFLKRFLVSEDLTKPTLVQGVGNKLICITHSLNPKFEISFGGKDAHRLPIIVDAQDFVGVKGIQSKGKRLTTYEIKNVSLHSFDSEDVSDLNPKEPESSLSTSPKEDSESEPSTESPETIFE